MSQQDNVELVQAIFAAWEAGDFGASDWADPGIEFVIADGPSRARFDGVSAMAEGWANVLSAWQGYRVQATSFRALDEERVLVELHAAGRGRVSGVELGSFGDEGANVFHVRGGKVTRLLVYFDKASALAELGEG
jgi:ketosteroid isomerase-like protein